MSDCTASKRRTKRWRRRNAPRLAVLWLALLLAGCGGPDGNDDTPLRDGGRADGSAPPSCLRMFHGECLELVIQRNLHPTVLAVDDGYLYYHSAPGSDLRRTSLAGGGDESLALVERVSALVADGDHLYFATAPISGMANAEVGRVPKTGGIPEWLVTGLTSNADIAVDGSDLYYTARDAGEVRRVPIVGGANELLFNGNSPGRIFAHGGHLYWTDYLWITAEADFGYVLTHATSDLMFAETLETSLTGWTVALGPAHLYLYSAHAGEISRTPTTAGATELLGSVPMDPVYRANGVAVSLDYVYAITRGDHLVRLPVDGGSVEDIFVHDFFFDLVADTSGAYVAVSNEGTYFVPNSL